MPTFSVVTFDNDSIKAHSTKNTRHSDTNFVCCNNPLFVFRKICNIQQNRIFLFIYQTFIWVGIENSDNAKPEKWQKVKKSELTSSLLDDDIVANLHLVADFFPQNNNKIKVTDRFLISQSKTTGGQWTVWGRNICNWPINMKIDILIGGFYGTTLSFNENQIGIFWDMAISSRIEEVLKNSWKKVILLWDNMFLLWTLYSSVLKLHNFQRY